jgi:hypothetical protein
MILRNMAAKASRAAERGRSEPPYAYMFTPDQEDPNTARRLLRTLQDMGVEVHVADADFRVGGAVYPRGTHVVFCGQTARPFIVSLLGRTVYRDSLWVRAPDGSPMMNYDFATQTMAEFKGVRVVEAGQMPEGRFSAAPPLEPPKGSVEKSAHGHVFDGRINDSFKALNALHRAGVQVHRVTEETEAGGVRLPAGAFYVPPQGKERALGRAAKGAGLRLMKLDEEPGFSHKPVKPLRVAVYQRYWGGNTDEGWTRWLLEQFGFEYVTVRDKEVRDGLEGFDVLVLPSDAPALITGEKVEEYYEKRFKGSVTAPVLPPEYRTGIGEEGVKRLREWVEKGGTLLCLNESCEFATEKLGVPVQNVVKDLGAKEFHCPGSTLRVNVDGGHPLAYGMPADGLVLLRGNQAYAVKQVHSGEDYRVVVSYPEEDIMQSGWLIGERHLARKAAMVEARVKAGRVVLYGFSPQMRALTDATFKLFFNALVG